jgi:hypothetical protein
MNIISDFHIQVKAAQETIVYFERLPGNTIVAFSDGSELARSEAENVMAHPTVKERICASLQSVSNDLDKITEKSTEVLWALALSGTIFVPQNPMLYGWVGILIYRATVKGFCTEFQKKITPEKK